MTNEFGEKVLKMADGLRELKTVAIERVELQFGEKVYQVGAAGLNRSEMWRGRLQAEINAILALLKEQGGVFENIDLGNLKEISNMGLVELMPVIGALFAQLNVSMSALGELISLYHRDLEQDWDYILEYATTKQAVAAVMEMIKLEYPFGLIFNQNGSKPGPAAATTSPNSHGQPGTSRRKH